MLTEAEITYLKKLLRQKSETFEQPHVLHDIIRHLKYTIRIISKQMAGVDNRKIFSDNRELNQKSTSLLAKRAQLLYDAKSDAQKMFKHLASVLYDEDALEELLNRDEKQAALTPEDEKFLKKYEHLLKRVLSQANNYQSLYSFAEGVFLFRG